MEERPAENDFWQRQGCSLVWDKTLLAQLLQKDYPLFSLREVLTWPSKGLPPGLSGGAVLVEGLQTCLAVLEAADENETLLSRVVQPFIRHWQNNWRQLALIFILHCNAQDWTVSVNNFAFLRLRHDLEIEMTALLWRGAARNAIALTVAPQEEVVKTGKTGSRIYGGFCVLRYA